MQPRNAVILEASAASRRAHAANLQALHAAKQSEAADSRAFEALFRADLANRLVDDVFHGRRSVDISAARVPPLEQARILNERSEIASTEANAAAIRAREAEIRARIACCQADLARLEAVLVREFDPEDLPTPPSSGDEDSPSPSPSPTPAPVRLRPVDSDVPDEPTLPPEDFPTVVSPLILPLRPRLEPEMEE